MLAPIKYLITFFLLHFLLWLIIILWRCIVQCTDIHSFMLNSSNADKNTSNCNQTRKRFTFVDKLHIEWGSMSQHGLVYVYDEVEVVSQLHYDIRMDSSNNDETNSFRKNNFSSLTWLCFYSNVWVAVMWMFPGTMSDSSALIAQISQLFVDLMLTFNR